MLVRTSRSILLHLVGWTVGVLYLLLAPGFVASVSNVGKPLRAERSIPADSEAISLVVEGVEPVYGHLNLWNLYGMAYIDLHGTGADKLYERELVLISDERTYFFPTEAVSRQPNTDSYFAALGVDTNLLGFKALILSQALERGRYRVGILFRRDSDGLAHYTDKPAYYLIRSPNTIQLIRK